MRRKMFCMFALVIATNIFVAFPAAAVSYTCDESECFPNPSDGGGDGGGDAGGSSGGNGGGGNDSDPGNGAESGGGTDAAALDMKMEGDIRCVSVSGNSYRDVTSRDDETARALVAMTVFRSLTLGSRARSAVSNAGFLTVTYADGGTEQWVVPNPSFTDGGINAPIPGTRTDGGGVKKDNNDPGCTAKRAGAA